MSGKDVSVTAAPPKLPRIHALDRLRAVMMLLGLVLHISLSYQSVPPAYMRLPYQDPQSNLFFLWLYIFIHSFRMPAFFMVAGFFAAFLYETRGPKRFLQHRLQRIGIPLFWAWLVMLPLTSASFFYAESFNPTPRPALFLGHQQVLDNILLHLWFLWHLLVLCFAAFLVAPLVERLGKKLRERSVALFRQAITRGRAAVTFALLTSLLLYPMELWEIRDSLSLFPPLTILGTYALFFTFGWLLFKARELLDFFIARAWRYFAAGFVCHALYLFFYYQGFEHPATPDRPLLSHPLYALFHAHGWSEAAATGTHVLAVLCLALTMWLLVFGFLGLFLRYLDKPNACFRYLCDASYWMYITHMPLAVALPAIFVGVSLSVWLKFGLVLGLTSLITLVTYHYWVRATFIGAMLNGRRYPRTLPWRE